MDHTLPSLQQSIVIAAYHRNDGLSRDSICTKHGHSPYQLFTVGGAYLCLNYLLQKKLFDAQVMKKHME